MCGGRVLAPILLRSGYWPTTCRRSDGAVNEATAVFRTVRKLLPSDEDNFVIEKSDKLAETFIGLLGSIRVLPGPLV